MTDVTPSTTPEEVLERRERLYEGTRLLQRRLQAPVDDPDRWRTGLAVALATVHDVMLDHVTATEEPAGFFDQLTDETTGRLATTIEELREEHARITGLVTDLRHAMGNGAGPGTVRKDAIELFELLDAHRHRGADLLWQAYGQEVGVRD